MRPTRASPTSSESMTTNETSSAPATPVMRAEPTGREIAAPAATSTRGLIIVLSAPVSSSRFALAVPLTFTSTMIRWPGVYLIEVPPGFGPAGAVFPLEPHRAEGRQEFAPGGDLRKPGRKDDDEVRAALGHEPEHARLPFPAVGPDLRRHETHEVQHPAP